MYGDVIPSGRLSVGSFNIPLNVKFNYESPNTYFKNNKYTTNPFNSTFNRLYSPLDSVTADQNDVFRYCDGEG